MPNENTPGIGDPIQPSSFDELLVKLRDFHDGIRVQAAFDLGELGDKRAVQPLIGRLENDKSPLVRSAAAKALFQLKDEKAWAIISKKVQSDNDAEVAASCAKIIGNLGIKEFAKDLLPGLTKNKLVQEEAAAALGKLKNPDVITELVREERIGDGQALALVKMGKMVIKGLINSIPESRGDNEARHIETGSFSLPRKPPGNIFSNSDWGDQYSNRFQGWNLTRIAILGKIGDPGIEEIKPFLSKVPRSRHFVAIAGLAKINSSASTPLLCHILDTHKNLLGRGLALNGIGKRDSPEVRKALLKSLDREKYSDTMRQYAAYYLSFHNSEEVVTSLCKVAQNDSHNNVRKQAVLSLKNIGNSNATPILCKVALADLDLSVRLEAIDALARLKDARSVPTLGQLLFDDPKESIRSNAANAIGEVGASAGINYLISGLGSDGSKEVRATCASSLGLLNDPVVLDALSAVAKDDSEDSSVKEAAAKAIKKINRKQEE